jgi:hypothetical protein
MPGRGNMPTIGKSGIIEFNELFAALKEAGRLLFQAKEYRTQFGGTASRASYIREAKAGAKEAFL